MISRYKTETAAVSRLKHDNIFGLQDFGVLDDGQLFMCFEYIERKSLDRYVVERGAHLDVRKAVFSSCVTSSSTRVSAVWCIVISSPTT